MKKYWFLLAFLSAQVQAQEWKTLKIDEDVSFGFPSFYEEKDSAGLKVYTGKDNVAFYRVTKSLSKNPDLFSWETGAVLLHYEKIRDSIQRATGMVLHDDEVFGLGDIKAARFTFRDSLDSRLDRYSIFYLNGHLYSFRMEGKRDRTPNPWDEPFFADIAIGAPRAVPIAEPEVSHMASFPVVYLTWLPIILIPSIALAAIVTIAWSRRKKGKSGIM